MNTLYKGDDDDDDNNNNHHLYHPLLRQAGLFAAWCLAGRLTSSEVQWDVSLKPAHMEVKGTGICICRQY